MFLINSTRLLPRCNSLLARHLLSRQYNSNPPTIKGHWPEPITQQTLDEFLKEINYFEEPRKFVNIGIKTPNQQRSQTPQSDSEIPTPTLSDSKIASDLDDVLEILGGDAQLPPLNYDDTNINTEQIVQLAISHGIYRDLFGRYEPNRDNINFTPQQAENLDKLIPHYWITDLPHSRVSRNQKEPEPLHYFEPIVGISARFVNTIPQADNEQYAHTSYHGNIIPAADCAVKPSITLDFRNLSPSSSNFVNESDFDNWKPGSISTVNTAKSGHGYYTVALLNLDSLHPNSANLHWMITNVESSKDGNANYDELCDYLPVHGIRGFGYSRYVFLVLQHQSKVNPEQFKISTFSLEDRRFDCKSFLDLNKSINMVPVGTSWFQTNWDVTSNKIFHDYLQMKAPTFELLQQKMERRPLRKDYPGKVPFNIFLDYQRDKKEINEQVLLERLKSVDPFDYKDQYVPPKVPPTVFEDEGLPSWMKIVMFKKKNRIGYWRGLRPASVTLPLDNNADLDYPLRPLASSNKSPPGYHNVSSKPKLKMLKKLPVYSKPVSDFSAAFIQEDHEVHLDTVRQMMKDHELKEKEKTATNKKSKKNEAEKQDT